MSNLEPYFFPLNDFHYTYHHTYPSTCVSASGLVYCKTKMEGISNSGFMITCYGGYLTYYAVLGDFV